MAVTWGAWQISGSGQKTRLGIDLYYTGDPNSGSVTVWRKWWREAVYSIGDSSVTLNRAGDFGSSSVGFSWTSTGPAEIPGSAQSSSVSTLYGSTKTVSVNGSITGVYNGLVPTHSRSITIPARDYLVPRPPSSASVARVSDTSHTVSWVRDADSSSGAQPWTGVKISRWDNVSQTYSLIATVTGTGTSYNDLSTHGDRKYRYAVKSYNSAGESSSTLTNAVYTTPKAPEHVTATKDGADIVVEWDDASFSETDFDVWDEATSSWIITGLAAGTTSWRHENANASVTHTYKVRAVNPTGSAESGLSNTVQLLTEPAAPSNLSPTGVFDATFSKVFGWKHNPVDTTAQTAYETEYREQGSSTWLPLSGGKTLSATSSQTVPGGTFANGTAYEWRVRTWGQYVNPSPWTVGTFPTSATPTATITAPSGTLSGSSMLVEWAYYQAGGVAQAGFQISVTRADGSTLHYYTGSGSATSYAVPVPVADGETYTVSVKVLSGDGLWSESDTASVPVDYAPPPEPSATVEWQPENGAALITITNPDFAVGEEPTVSNEVYRSIDGGEWVLIARDVPPNVSIYDHTPALGRVNAYRVVAFSALPSSLAASVEPEVIPDAKGWIWFNYGPGFASSIRLRDNASVDVSPSRAKTLNTYAGRTKPVETVGAQRRRVVSVSADLGPDSPSMDEVEDFAFVPAPICYRDPHGRRLFTSVSSATVNSRRLKKKAQISVEEIDHTEGTVVPSYS